uniref:Uncharacterized protein n=1 Tax=mine drainage metagenome TaxID=410659 RepID=E6QDH4_9ZZZZ
MRKNRLKVARKGNIPFSGREIFVIRSALPVKTFLPPQSLSITATPQENIACPVPSLCSPSRVYGPYPPPAPWPTPSGTSRPWNPACGI